MKAKEDKIREAYGEHWESVKDFVDENGWIINAISITRNVILEMQRFYDNTRFLCRPKSLQGIENNNGWLPYTGNSIGYLDIVYTDKENVFPYAVYVQYSSINELQKITHYQQIICPPKPLY